MYAVMLPVVMEALRPCEERLAALAACGMAVMLLLMKPWGFARQVCYSCLRRDDSCFFAHAALGSCKGLLMVNPPKILSCPVDRRQLPRPCK